MITKFHSSIHGFAFIWRKKCKSTILAQHIYYFRNKCIMVQSINNNHNPKMRFKKYISTVVKKIYDPNQNPSASITSLTIKKARTLSLEAWEFRSTRKMLVSSCRCTGRRRWNTEGWNEGFRIWAWNPLNLFLLYTCGKILSFPYLNLRIILFYLLELLSVSNTNIILLGWLCNSHQLIFNYLLTLK